MRRLASMALVSACLGCLSVQAGALTLVSSRFDSHGEGWVAVNGVLAQGWLPSAGGGGYFSAIDGGPGVIWVFQAPGAYLGNQSAALGGSLSFSLMTSTLAQPMSDSAAYVKLGGNGLDLVTSAGPAPGLDWTPYNVTLAPGAWRVGSLSGPLATQADFTAVLAAVSYLRIRGEFSGALDRGSIDNVVLSAVPEPASALLWLAGLAGVLGWRGWRGRRGR